MFVPDIIGDGNSGRGGGGGGGLYFQIIPFAAVLSEKGIISMESIC